ncbi:hypothetical protein GCM10009733_089910 [Nonomuraea maheshkhaliensis]|uniref:Uncharacterized protein n=1 Tax=Nonomuraea maheshkhaliensis TaxID=419590 RepID=A0ABN2GYN3_9ACTN
MGADEQREPAHFSGEGVGAAEGLRREGGQVIDVGGPARAEERLEQRVGQQAAVEDLDELVQLVLAARVLE